MAQSRDEVGRAGAGHARVGVVLAADEDQVAPLHVRQGAAQVGPKGAEPGGVEIAPGVAGPGPRVAVPSLGRVQAAGDAGEKAVEVALGVKGHRAWHGASSRPLGGVWRGGRAASSPRGGAGGAPAPRTAQADISWIVLSMARWDWIAGTRSLAVATGTEISSICAICS